MMVFLAEIGFRAVIGTIATYLLWQRIDFAVIIFSIRACVVL